MHSLKSTITLWALLCLLSIVVASSQHNDGHLGVYDRLVARQDDATTATDEETQTTEAAETETAAETTATGTDSDEPTETGTATDTASDSEETETEESTATTSVDPREPPGGIEMVTPGPHASDTYIKIGDYATFAWNYTSLVITPSAIDVVAYCSRNDVSYTISSNQSVEETGKVIWDTSDDAAGETPLLTEMYTFMVYDPELGPSEPAEPGHLGSISQHTFGMYKPQPYTPGFKCPTCSAAMSDVERQAYLFMFAMIAITVCSFTWFASGFGVFS